MHVTARRHRDRDRTQEHAHETCETQEAPRAFGSTFDLRARIADVAQALGGLLVEKQPRLEIIDAASVACEQDAIAHATPRLNELRGGQVLHVHEKARGEIGKCPALIGQRDEHVTYAKRGRTDSKQRSDLPTGRREQPRIGPYFTAWRNARGHLSLHERRIRYEHMPAQWIAGTDGVDIRQLALVALKHDA